VTYRITAIDRQALPDEMLDLVKAHCRVDFTDDDSYLVNCTGRAISIFERVSGWLINPATVKWSPAITATDSMYRTPVQPVSAFKAFDAALADISALFALHYTSLEGPHYLASISGGPWSAGTTVDLTAGYDLETMPFEVQDGVLRVAATLYEMRETIDAASMQLVPGWANEMLTGIWIPRL
jgi:uncharacterized phiE125 gp8 family phage protein